LVRSSGVIVMMLLFWLLSLDLIDCIAPLVVNKHD